MAKRSIRLKELAPGIDVMQRPQPQYLARTNGTLKDSEYRTRVDSNGAICTGNGYVFPEGARRLIMLGDSFVEGSFLPENERFASLLERGFAGEVEVRNYSYSGTTTLQMLHLFLAKIACKYDPKTTSIVYFTPTSDVDALELEGGYWNNTVRYSPVLPANAEPVSREIPALEQVLPVTRTLFAALNEFGFDFQVAFSPFMELKESRAEAYLFRYFGSRRRAETVVLSRARQLSIIRDACRESGVRTIDLHSHLGGHLDYFYDDRHLNPVGSRKVAMFLNESVK